MIIDYLNIRGLSVIETETYPPLIVYTDGILTNSVLFKFFKVIIRRYFQIHKI